MPANRRLKRKQKSKPKPKPDLKRIVLHPATILVRSLNWLHDREAA